MSRHLAILAAIIIAAIISLLMMVTMTHAHLWYSGKRDPVTGTSCCGDRDCAEIPGRNIEAVEDGYRVTLTREEARKINEHATRPVNTVIAWDRIQPSGDGNFHACLYNDADLPDGRERAQHGGGVVCLFAPPNT